jgi:uncharacterized protein involved in exopolysaccharide biosynthesis
MNRRQSQPYQIAEAQIVSDTQFDSNVEESGSNGFNLHEFAFILFSHKWKILICTLIGLIAAAFVYFGQDSVYRSDAKLLVHYVIDITSDDVGRPHR